MKRFVAGKNEEGMRLSRFVQRVTQGLPEARMYKGFRNKRIKRNGRHAPPDARIQEGDVIELYLNDEFFPHNDVGHRPVKGKALPSFGVEYEDADIAIIYKPAGVLSHRDERAAPGLLDAFTDALVRRGEYTPGDETTFAPALAGRLDFGTEGLVPAAKNAQALRALNEIVRLNKLHKTYLCVTTARPEEGRHEAFLLRDKAQKTVAIYDTEQPGAKAISTEAKVLEGKRGLWLCEVRLHTGRTHQIRAHLAFLGAPLLGDVKYGGARPVHTPKPEPDYPFQALCAWKLRFDESLPPENPLARLAGREFVAKEATLPRWWAQLGLHTK